LFRGLVDEARIRELWEDLFGDDLREQGREQGMREMASSMAQTAWEGRFGPPDEEVRSALQGAEVDALKALVTNFTTDTREQARQRLGLPPAPVEQQNSSQG
jgi:hypothetical protein